MWAYLKEAGIPWTPDLATAFLYGIKTETRDLGRGVRAARASGLPELQALG